MVFAVIGGALSRASFSEDLPVTSPLTCVFPDTKPRNDDSSAKKPSFAPISLPFPLYRRHRDYLVFHCIRPK